MGRPFSMEPYIPVRGQSTGRSDKRRLRRTVEVEPELETPTDLPRHAAPLVFRFLKAVRNIFRPASGVRGGNALAYSSKRLWASRTPQPIILFFVYSPLSPPIASRTPLPVKGTDKRSRDCGRPGPPKPTHGRALAQPWGSV